MRTAQLDLVGELDRAVFPEDRRADTSRGEWWLAFDGDRAIAFAGCRLVDDGRAAFLSRAGVLPSHRGMGIQLKLIRARMRWASERAVDAVITYTTLTNVASQRSLISAGFRPYRPTTEWAGGRMIYWRRDA
jgi:GNAT superfamily N-acetyltransferase